MWEQIRHDEVSVTAAGWCHVLYSGVSVRGVFVGSLLWNNYVNDLTACGRWWVLKKIESDNDSIIVQLKAGTHYMTFKTHAETQ